MQPTATAKYSQCRLPLVFTPEIYGLQSLIVYYSRRVGCVCCVSPSERAARKHHLRSPQSHLSVRYCRAASSRGSGCGAAHCRAACGVGARAEPRQRSPGTRGLPGLMHGSPRSCCCQQGGAALGSGVTLSKPWPDVTIPAKLVCWCL